MYTSMSFKGVAVEQIPLKIRCCFVRSILLLTRYPQLGGKQAAGTYNSPIVSSYKYDPIPDDWYEPDAIPKLCQLFGLSNSYAQEIENLLAEVDLKIERQQKIIEALVNKFDLLNQQENVLSLFQALFGDIPLPAASINCLSTKMQITFIIDRQKNRLHPESLWSSLSKLEQQKVSQFLAKVDQFSFQQFANFPSFNNLEIQNNSLKLWQYLTKLTGYSQSEIIRAISSSVNIISAEKAESFLLHDIGGHYWQSILTQFGNDYLDLRQVNQDLGLDSSVDNDNGRIYFRELFKLQNQSIVVDIPLAKQFFHSMAKKRVTTLSTHLIGEMLADINEYKWLSQKLDQLSMHKDIRQALLNSSSSFPNSPTKLDLTIKDWDFLYLPTLASLIKLSPALEANLIGYFQLKNNEVINSLRIAIANLHHLFLTEYINHYQSPIKNDSDFGSPISSLSELQNVVDKLYTKPVNHDSISFQDLILLFVGNYYSTEFEQDITQVKFALKNYFYPCWQLLEASLSSNI